MIARVLLGLLAILLTLPAVSAEPYRCRIGKPSYCFKYGGVRCARANPKGVDGCAEWRAACLACHAELPACLDHGQVKAGTPRCTHCEHEWEACMNKADAAHWPNRKGG
jgi:hypothetical protein